MSRIEQPSVLGSKHPSFHPDTHSCPHWLIKLSQNNPVASVQSVLPHLHAASFAAVPSVCVHVGNNWQVFVDDVQNKPLKAVQVVLPHLHIASFRWYPLVKSHGDAEHWLVELSQINPVASVHGVLTHVHGIFELSQNNPDGSVHGVLPHVHAASFGVVPSVCVHVENKHT